MAILEVSSRQLGVLRMQVQDLVTFFRDILNEVDLAVREEVEKEFLRPLEKKILYNKDGIPQGVRLTRKISRVCTTCAYYVDCYSFGQQSS